MKIIKANNIKEGRFKIELEKDDRGRIVLPVFINKPPNALAQMVMFVEESGFDEDMQKLVPESTGYDLFDTCYKLVRKLIDSHLVRYGRIQPADLEVY